MVRKAIESKHRDKRFPDRIFRGRILKLVRENGSVALDEIGPAVDAGYDATLDRDWIVAMVGRMEKDGMLSLLTDRITLPRDL